MNTDSRVSIVCKTLHANTGVTVGEALLQEAAFDARLFGKAQKSGHPSNPVAQPYLFVTWQITI